MAGAFGEGWAFLPLGALIVDFTLTIAVSCAAGASALIAWVPELADGRIPIAIGLASLVAAGCLLGHRGRRRYGVATIWLMPPNETQARKAGFTAGSAYPPTHCTL